MRRSCGGLQLVDAVAGTRPELVGISTFPNVGDTSTACFATYLPAVAQSSVAEGMAIG